MIHQLKTESNYFKDIVSGKKPFEVRFNDRNFSVGDFLGLNEVDVPGIYTGRCCLVEIVYVLTDSRLVKDGYVILGIRPCAIEKSTDRVMFEYNSDRFYAVPSYEGKAG